MRDILIDFFNKIIKKNAKECISLINENPDIPFNKIIEQTTNNNILHLSFFNTDLFDIIYSKYPELNLKLNINNEYPLHLLLRNRPIAEHRFKELINADILAQNNKSNEDIPYIVITKKYKDLVNYLFSIEFKFNESHLAILNYYIKDTLPEYLFPPYVKNRTIIRPIYSEIDNMLKKGNLPYFDKPLAKKIFNQEILEKKSFNYFKLHCAFILFKAQINYDLCNTFLESQTNETFTLFEEEVELLLQLINKMKEKQYSDKSIIKLLKSIPDANTDIKSIKNIFPLFDLSEKCKFTNFDDFYSKINLQLNLIIIKKQETIELNQSITGLDNIEFSPDLIFKVPKTQKELAELGLKLRICVGTYTQRVLSKHSQICYLYDKIKKIPVICIDLDPSNYLAVKEIKYKNNEKVEFSVIDKVQRIIDVELSVIK